MKTPNYERGKDAHSRTSLGTPSNKKGTPKKQRDAKGVLINGGEQAVCGRRTAWRDSATTLRPPWRTVVVLDFFDDFSAGAAANHPGRGPRS